MTHVFISYAREDTAFVKKLRAAIERESLDVWLDSQLLQPGEDWRQAIDDGIRASFALIAVMTPAACASQYVTYEWSFALGLGKTVVPLLLEPTELHPRLEALQYLDFTDHFDDAPFARLNTRLKHIHDHYRPEDAGVSPCPDDLTPSLWKHLGALHDRKAAARREAAAALGEPGNCAAAPGLIVALRGDRSVAVRIAIVEALGQIGDARAVPALVQCLEDDAKLANSRRVCDHAADALERIATPEARGAVSRWRYGS